MYDDFGISRAYDKWVTMPESQKLEGFTAFKMMTSDLITNVEIEYMEREICCETPMRFTWLVYRLLNQLCVKYGPMIASMPDIDIFTKTEHMERQLNNTTVDNKESSSKTDGTAHTDSTAAGSGQDDGTSTTDGTAIHEGLTAKKGDDRTQAYPDAVGSPEEANNYSVAGATIDETNEDHIQDTTKNEVKNNSTQSYNDNTNSDSVNNTTSESKDSMSHSSQDNEKYDRYETDSNRILKWQEILYTRLPLSTAFIREFDKLFIPIIGDDLILEVF